MSVENYYEILGVSETATQDEIKKAYRKKAVEHHPDKGGSEEIFKKIASAYDVLGDENKRRDYDHRKNNPFQGGGGFNGFNPFEDFFGNQFYQQRKRNVPEKNLELTVTVLESFRGIEKIINYMRNTSCNSCNGQGGDRKDCHVCKGEGFLTLRQGTGMFIQLTRQVCNNCKGKGYILTQACYSCNGNTTTTSTESLSIKLPHGVDNGQTFRLSKKGDFNNGIYGDLIIKINLIPENNFEKSGNDLIYNLFFSYEDLNKDTIEIPHPHGQMSISLPKEFDTSKPLRVKSKGFNINGQGDLFIKQYVRFKKYS